MQVDPLIGESLGGYTIRQELGRGGMAIVYLADQPQMGRQVAIKVLPTHYMHDPSFRERFIREAKAIASLTHPHILPVHDYGENRGWAYIVMTYMGHGDLMDMIHQSGNTIPLSIIEKIIGQVASALDCAHGQGVIHRDLKPSNILLAPRDNVYLSDFGIAKVVETSASLTASGVIGTPAYMAPEMANPGCVTPLVDVYALGVTLYQMITSKLPYDAETAMGLLVAHVTQPIPDARDLRPDLPLSVQTVIENAMSKDPTKRVPTAGEVARQLSQALQETSSKHPIVKNLPTPIPRAETIGRTQIAPTADDNTTPVDLSGPLAGLARITKKLAMSGRETAKESPLLAPEETVEPKHRTIRLLIQLVWQALALMVGLIIIIASLTAGNILLSERPRRYDNKGHLMIQLPVATFTMGGDADEAYEICRETYWRSVCFRELFEDEMPRHQVTLTKPVWMDAFEVSNKQYRACVDEGKCQVVMMDNVTLPENYFTAADYDKFPVVGVTWAQALAFCQWRGGRLPTEAEWEFAAKGYTHNIYPWGNESPSCFTRMQSVNCQTNTDTESYNPLSTIDSNATGLSPFGFFNMAGNAAEWVMDWYGDYPDEAVTDPSGPENGEAHVLRGGSAMSPHNYGRVTARDSSTENPPAILAGIRCVIEDLP